MGQTCPSCSRPASGRFCEHCGANLDTRTTCHACGNELAEGNRFCNQCGAPAGPARSAASAVNVPATEAPPRSVIPWAIAAGAMALLLGVLLWPRFDREGDTLAPAVGPPITGTRTGVQGVDLATMTPREAADRLFNRVMQAVSRGDTAEARQFVPMALQAYDRVDNLDRDGRYHLSVLHLVNDDPRAARAEAEHLLSEVPNHLLGLATAAQAELAMGNETDARSLFRRFLENYDAELARGLPEYQEHQAVLPSLQADARQVVGR